MRGAAIATRPSRARIRRARSYRPASASGIVDRGVGDVDHDAAVAVAAARLQLVGQLLRLERADGAGDDDQRGVGAGLGARQRERRSRGGRRGCPRPWWRWSPSSRPPRPVPRVAVGVGLALELVDGGLHLRRQRIAGREREELLEALDRVGLLGAELDRVDGADAVRRRSPPRSRTRTRSPGVLRIQRRSASSRSCRRRSVALSDAVWSGVIFAWSAVTCCEMIESCGRRHGVGRVQPDRQQRRRPASCPAARGWPGSAAPSSASAARMPAPRRRRRAPSGRRCRSSSACWPSTNAATAFA